MILGVDGEDKETDWHCHCFPTSSSYRGQLNNLAERSGDHKCFVVTLKNTPKCANIVHAAEYYIYISPFS
jgi:hypothetical protein